MNVTPLFPRAASPGGQIGFDRSELNLILNLYGRMVSAGLWRDYAIAHERDVAIFAAFRRSTDRPEYQIIKRPALAMRQGQYALIGEIGVTLKRGNELQGVLASIERKLLKLVDA